jgi:hypothetical protein
VEATFEKFLMMKVAQRLLSPIIFTILFAASGFGQQTSGPEKIATLDDQADLSVFNQKLNELVAAILKRPETTRAFVALAGKDYKALIARLKAVRAIEKARPELKRRISYTQPGTRYEPNWTETEFWIVPDNSRPPYFARTADCGCSTLEIEGKPTIDKKTTLVTYSTRYPTQTWLDEPITFLWTVKGGKIVSGQGTQAVTVKRKRNDTEPIEVKLKVQGWEDCMCLTDVSFTTTVVKIMANE